MSNGFAGSDDLGFTPEGRPIHRYQLGQYRQSHAIMLFEMLAQLPWDRLVQEPGPDDGLEFRKFFEGAEEIEVFSGMGELCEEESLAELISSDLKTVFDEYRNPPDWVKKVIRRVLKMIFGDLLDFPESGITAERQGYVIGAFEKIIIHLETTLPETIKHHKYPDEYADEAGCFIEMFRSGLSALLGQYIHRPDKSVDFLLGYAKGQAFEVKFEYKKAGKGDIHYVYILLWKYWRMMPFIEDYNDLHTFLEEMMGEPGLPKPEALRKIANGLGLYLPHKNRAT
ncbi:MAG: hypothetical protein Q7Q73_14655 [Verrucomicrobiota bacterium JB024]|nr:hypothetical protein [Verrucomicrobiota bacterium JB024]